MLRYTRWWIAFTLAAVAFAINLSATLHAEYESPYYWLWFITWLCLLPKSLLIFVGCMGSFLFLTIAPDPYRDIALGVGWLAPPTAGTAWLLIDARSARTLKT